MSVFYPQVTHNIGGNTSGTTAHISDGTLFLAGGNNITLSQNANTITISAAAGGGTGGDAIRGIAAGGSTQTTDTVNFSNSNGFSFGFSSTDITASHNALTSQSTQYLAVQLGGNTAGTTSFNASNNASLILHGGNNITLSGNGSTITISAGASGSGGDAIRGIAAGGSTQTTDTVNFSNSNGFSFGFTSTDLTASHNAITSQSTQYLAIELGGNTAGTTSFNASNNASIFLHGGNNITLSGNGSTITISGGAGSGAVPVVYKYPPDYVSKSVYNLFFDTRSTSSNSFTLTLSLFVNYRPQIADVHFNQIDQMYDMLGGNGTASGTNNMALGLYTKNGASLSLVSSFHAAILHSQNSSSAVSLYWWWGTNSTTNSSSTAGNVRSLFTGDKRIIFYAGSAATLTSGNYYLVQGLYRSTGVINVFGLNRIYGNFAAIQRFLNNSNVDYGNDLMGRVSTSTTGTQFANAFVMPDFIATSNITLSGTQSSIYVNYAIDLYSTY